MRLIDADELIKFGWEMHRPVVNVLGVKSYEIASLEQVKEVDAIPVVRCRDCKHWLVDCFSKMDEGNWFCAGGVRKDGTDDERVHCARSGIKSDGNTMVL